MKKISMMVAALAMAVGGSMGIGAAPAQAQAVVWTCRADSPYAFGVWKHSDLDFACLRAKQECAARSPYGSVCYATRWWYEYQ